MLRRINLPELGGAAFVLFLGASVLYIGSGYSIGSLARMGTGFFPVVLGSLLLFLGALLVLEVWRLPQDGQFRMPFRPILMVGLGIVSFAFLVERAGMVPAICAVVGLSSLAESPIRPITALVLMAAMSLIGVVLFIRLLGLPLSAFGG